MRQSRLKVFADRLRGWGRRLWRAATELPDEWETTEIAVQRRMRVQLHDHLDLVRQIDALAFNFLGRLEPGRQSQEVLHAHVTLCARVLQDLRVAAQSALSGYVMQSWAVTASAFEAAHTMGYIAADPERAKRWVAHTDFTVPYCRAKTAVEGSFRYLDLGRQGKQRVKWVDQEYFFYEQMCAGKHVHPLAEQTRYIRQRKGTTRLILTPFYSARRAREARRGILVACRAATLALWVLHKAHIGEADSGGQAELLSMMETTGQLLEKWKDV